MSKRRKTDERDKRGGNTTPAGTPDDQTPAPGPRGKTRSTGGKSRKPDAYKARTFEGAAVRGFRKLAYALARHGLKISYVALSKWAKDTRWYDAGFSRTGPWPETQLAPMARWISEHQPEARPDDEEIEKRRTKKNEAIGSASLDDIQKLIAKVGLKDTLDFARTKWTVEKAENEKLRRLIQQGKYVRREEIDAADAKKREAIKQGLERTVRALRQPLADETDPAKIEAMLMASIRNLCNQGFGGKW